MLNQALILKSAIKSNCIKNVPTMRKEFGIKNIYNLLFLNSVLCGWFVRDFGTSLLPLDLLPFLLFQDEFKEINLEMMAMK